MLKPIFFVILHAVCENAFCAVREWGAFCCEKQKIGYNESEESY